MSGESLKDLFAVASVAARAEVTACPAALPASRAWGGWSPPASPSSVLMLWKQLISPMFLN